MARNTTDTDIIYRFQDCLSSELNDLDFHAGTLIFCRDTGECYYDNLEGDRVTVSQYIKFFATDSDRANCFDFETNILYIVNETNKLWVYAGGWICLNPDIDTSFYFDIENLEVPTGTTGLVVTDSRIKTTCTGSFTPLPSIADLFGSATVTCSNGSATIKLVNTNYPMIGTLKISGTEKN